MTSGRTCPLDYRYSPTEMRVSAHDTVDVLYVVGGLYGNEQALDALLDLFDRELGRKHLIFNGDFNWFNVSSERFRRINERVLSFDALRGNVETELSKGDNLDQGVGCGCGYPDWVDDVVVERSNMILRRLAATAAQYPQLQQRLRALPMWKRIDVGSLPVGVVHGDAESLGGWGFAPEHLNLPEYRMQARRWFNESGVRIFACTHTCSPVLSSMANGEGQECVIINNGAAGMPNFSHAIHGVLTRIGTSPHQGDHTLYATKIDDVYVEALRVAYDDAGWRSAFLEQWAPGSAAHTSYWRRIRHGPQYELSRADQSESIIVD